MADMKELNINELDLVVGGNTVNTGTDDKAQVRFGPEKNWAKMCSLPNGTQVTVISGSLPNPNMNDRPFVQISFMYNGVQKTGWIAASIVKN